MILIGLGSNVTGPWGKPAEALVRALGELDRSPLRLDRASDIISTEPWGKADQPVYANAVARIRTRLQPLDLLAHLRAMERAAGRERLQGDRTLGS